MLIPKLRYSEFKEKINKVYFGDIVNYQKGFAFKSKDYTKSGIRIIRITDMTDSSIKNEDAIYIDIELASQYIDYQLKTNDIVITSVGSRPPLYDSMVGKVILIPLNANNSLLNQNAIRFRTIDKVNQLYLYNYLKKKRYTTYIETIMRGNANQRSITLEDLFKFELYVPQDKKEQEKISNLFKLLDKKIELQKQKIEALKLYKIYIIQKFLKDNIFSCKKIKQICSLYSGGTPISTNKNFYSGKIPFIRSGEINKNSTELFISDEALNNSSAKIVKKGDILLALYGATSGEIAISKIEGAINQAVLCINSIDSSILNNYIKIYLEYYKDKIINKYLQGGQGNLSASIVKNIEIYYPSIEKQIQIIDITNHFDKKMNLLKNELEELTNYKKTLLQQMFI